MVRTSSRKNDQKVKELFDVLENIKDEFESIERPTLEIETHSKTSQRPAPEVPQKNPSNYFKQIMPEYKKSFKRDKALDREAELLELEHEIGRSNSRGYSFDEISDWVYDLER